MLFIDTLAHPYLSEFDADCEITFQRAIYSDVGIMPLPNNDKNSWNPMLDLYRRFPSNCFAMAGLHPASVLPGNSENSKSNYLSVASGMYSSSNNFGI